MNTFREYYIVVNYYDGYPEFTTCHEKDGKFYKINNLENFFKNGSGISDEIIEGNPEFIKVYDKHKWRDLLSRL